VSDTPRKVRCPDCKAEGRSEPPVVGELFEHRGRLAWHGFDPRSAKDLENFTDDGESEPPQARHVWLLDVTAATEPLRGHCRRGHGWVSVSAAKSP
jgi:hypothetical protein